jgi:hypothetical protein
MALMKEMYSVSGINRIYQLLKNEAASGCPKDYDIKVDAMKVVSRNNDLERFFEHEQFLVASSKSIIVNIYDGTSPRCMKYTLLLEPERSTEQELSGIEKSFNTRIQQEKKSWEHDRLKSENYELRLRLDEKEKYASQLEELINTMRAEKEQMPGKVTNALISLAGLFLSNKNGQEDTSLLAGLLSPSETADEGTENFAATFRRADEAKTRSEERESTDFPEEDMQYTGTATEEDFTRLERSLIPLFPQEHRETVSTVVSVMYHNNNLIPEIAELLANEEQEQQQAA